ncbi:MAG: hypothetical protein JWQ72_662 [Polaromonas sp.]|nr:hypothetical protein [Polaromonas sp.]
MVFKPQSKLWDEQTPEQITSYYRNVQVGGVACVRDTHYGMLRYFLDDVERLHPKNGRIYLEKHGGFFAKSGKNCSEPTGQCSLAVPTEAVRAYIAANPPLPGTSYSEELKK